MSNHYLASDVDAIDANDFTSLICAVREGDKALVEARINAGDDVNAADTYGRTALMWAAIRGAKEIAELLIKAGADVNAADTYCRTALMLASEYGSEEIEDLLNRGEYFAKQELTALRASHKARIMAITMLRDDKFAMGFQSLVQYRKAILQELLDHE